MQYVVIILKRFKECSSHLKYFIFLSIFLQPSAAQDRIQRGGGQGVDDPPSEKMGVKPPPPLFWRLT